MAAPLAVIMHGDCVRFFESSPSPNVQAQASIGTFAAVLQVQALLLVLLVLVCDLLHS